METYRIITLNCRSGINSKTKLRKLIQYLKENLWHVALLQETSSISNKNKDIISKELEANIYHYSETPGKAGTGTATLIKNNICSENPECNYVNGGRFTDIRIKLNNNYFNIINVYINTKKGAKIQDFKLLDEYIKKIQNHIIIGGDFNSITEKGQRGGNIEHRTTDKELIDLIQNNYLYDGSKEFSHNKPTYIGPNNAAILDRFLYSDNNIIKEYNTVLCPFSDHQMVTIDLFNKIKCKKHKSYWKLNNSLLEDNRNIVTIKTYWEEWRLMKGNFKSISNWWEKGKKKIKEIFIEIGKRKAKQERDKMKELNKRIEQEMERGEINYELINNLRKELNELLEIKIEGARVRSRQLLLPEEEKGSKNFYNLEAKNIQQGAITSILNEENKEIIDPNLIKEEIYNFYEKLYTSTGVDNDSLRSLIENIKPNEIKQEDKYKLNKFISIQELWDSLKNMKNNKTPGNDGLTKEFYIKLWDTIGGDLVEVINNCFLEGELTTSQKDAEIKLLYKKGDKRLLKNWRPVSLLNVDYKILSSTISRRLTEILPHIITKTQGCAVKGRVIFENLRLIEDLIQRDEGNMEEWEGGIIKALDLEKAFDRIEHDYMFEVLEKFNMGNNYIRWIKLLYNKITTCVQTPFGSTNKINVTRSVRQGCPLSMTLFIICSEPFLREINNSDKIKGIRINNTTHLKVTAYADDTTIFLKDENDEKECERLIEKYEKASGCKCNKEKTKKITFGKYRIKKGIREQKEIEILGIWYHHNNRDRAQGNWEKVITEIKAVLNKLKCRHVSILGKVTLLNAYAVSNILYLNRIIPPDKNILKQLEKAVNNFIYEQRPPHYSNSIMARPTNMGGFGLPDLQTKCTAQAYTWITLYLNDNKHPWKTLFKQLAGKTLQQYDITYDTHYTNTDITRGTIYEHLKYKIQIDNTKWHNIQYKELYNTLIKQYYTKFDIEKNIPSLDWEEIWGTWKQRNISNKYKIQVHQIISDKFNTKTYKNRSGNCPMCDFPYVQSRDHSFRKCAAAAYLEEYVREKWGKYLNDDIIFYGKCNNEMFNHATAFIYTIIKYTRGWVGKWGTPPRCRLIQQYEKTLTKIQ